MNLPRNLTLAAGLLAGSVLFWCGPSKAQQPTAGQAPAAQGTQQPGPGQQPAAGQAQPGLRNQSQQQFGESTAVQGQPASAQPRQLQAGLAQPGQAQPGQQQAGQSQGQPQQGQQGQQAIDPASDLDVQYAALYLKLQRMELQRALEANERVAGAMPLAQIEELRESVRVAEEHLQQALQGGNQRSTQLRAAAAQARTAQINYEKALAANEEVPGTFPPFEVERLRLLAEVARLSYLRQRAADPQSALVEMQNEMNRLRQEVAQLRAALAAVSPEVDESSGETAQDQPVAEPLQQKIRATADEERGETAPEAASKAVRTSRAATPREKAATRANGGTAETPQKASGKKSRTPAESKAKQ